jgi:hypothetical protein
MTEVGRAPATTRPVAFALLSLPLLVGLVVPGLGILALGTPVLAWSLADRVWPQAGRWHVVGHAAGAVALVWLLPFVVTVLSPWQWLSSATEGLASLLIPLCGPDAIGLLLPAAAAVAAYSLVGTVAVRRGRPAWWLLAALAVPVVHALVLGVLVASGTGGEVTC